MITETGKGLIFLISLPRSGSTLLQKLLMTQQGVSSTAEPWIMLPCASLANKKFITSIYSHATSVVALESLFSELADGRADWIDSLRQYPLSLYNKLVGGNQYFLDKTPRYFLIWRELRDFFPEAKFIFLYRNPVSVYASFISTMRGGRLRRFDHFDVDFMQGPIAMTEASDALGEAACNLTYEELVHDPLGVMCRVCGYLELDFDESKLTEFNSRQLQGPGDRNINSTSIVEKRDDRWLESIDSSLRKKRVLSLIEGFNDNYLERCGLTAKTLVQQVKAVRSKHFRPEEYIYNAEEWLARKAKILTKRSSFG